MCSSSNTPYYKHEPKVLSNEVLALAQRHLEEWRQLNQELASQGKFVVKGKLHQFVLTTTINNHHVEELMEGLFSFDEGRRILAWSGVHLLGLGYISDEMWGNFQDWMETGYLLNMSEKYVM